MGRSRFEAENTRRRGVAQVNAAISPMLIGGNSNSPIGEKAAGMTRAEMRAGRLRMTIAPSLRAQRSNPHRRMDSWIASLRSQ